MRPRGTKAELGSVGARPKRALKVGKNRCCRYRLAASSVRIFATRSSLTRRSWSVRFMRSLRPRACGEKLDDMFDAEPGEGAAHLRQARAIGRGAGGRRVNGPAGAAGVDGAGNAVLGE